MRLPRIKISKPVVVYILLAILLLFVEITLLVMSIPDYEEHLIIKGILSILAIPLVISIFFTLAHISKTRKATLYLKQKPKRLLGFITKQSPQKIIEQVTLIAHTFSYTIEDIDESIGRIILSSPRNWNSWGFFYPVYFSNQNDGKTYVEIGIKSRLIQGGPLVTRAHKKFYNRVKNTITTNIEQTNTR